MANNYYTHGTYPTPNSPGSSALLRAELDLITAGFDKLPSLVLGNANRLVAINGAGNALIAVSTVSTLDVTDNGFTISDNGDATKKVAFQASGITTGTTRTLTVPDADLTLVGTATTQTLTNKTLGSGTVINAGTIDGVTIGGTTAAAGTFTSVTASSVTVSGSAVTTAANTQTLTNKTLTAPTINNGVIVGGTIDGATIGSGTPSSGTFTTIVATSGTVGGADIVTVSGTQTLTNKTLTSPAVTGGTVNNAVIGGTTPAAGTFTSLASSSLTVGGVAATTASNTQTLTNKTISGATNTLSNIGNTSLTNSSVTIGSTSVSLGGTAATIAGLSLTSPTISQITNSGTLTLPSTTDTLVGRATTDTLTNKTLSGANNTFSNIPNTAITGLGTMSTQNANSVTISGGSISGITDLAVADGGTGASTAANARVNLLPSYTGNGGKVLALNALGSDVEWSSVASGTVTSVAVSSTDLTVSGSPVTSSGTISLALNTVPVSKGGTGATTVAGARVALLPSYTSNASKVLALNSGGTDVEWVSIGGTGTVTSITAGTGLTGGTITATGTIAVDTAVVATLTDTQTLSNKTLTAPVISSIVNTGTLTLPTSTDTLVGRATTDTLTNKTISGASNTLSNIGNSSLTNSSVTIGTTSVALGATASTLAGLNSIALRNAGTGAFDVTVSHNGTLTAGRALTLNVNDAARTVSLSGNVTTAGALTTSGGDLTLTLGGATNVTLPTTGTLATLAGAETLTNKTLGSGTAITAGTINGADIGGSTPAAGTFTTLNANGNVVLGDNTADTLQIYTNAVTWSGTPTHSGNHTFSGDVTVSGTLSSSALSATLGANLRGDFSNATLTSRRYVQTTGANTFTSFGALPNGTGNASYLVTYNNSTPTNSAYLAIGAQNADTRLVSAVAGTGTQLPLLFVMGTTEAGRIDTGNQWGFGVTPNAGQGTAQIFRNVTGGSPATTGTTDANQIAWIGGGTVQLSFGAYASGAAWIQQRSSTGFGTNYDLVVQPNGGNLGVGTAPNASIKLDVGGSIRAIPAATQDAVILAGRAGGTGSYAVTITPATLTASRTVTLPDETFEVGFRNIPQNSQSAAYTLVLADAGKHILHPSADTTARTFTIPANGSVAYPVGTAITFVNQNGAGVVTIAITTDTMRLAGAGTTGSRTLAANGIATAIKVTSTEWIISGTGLT